MLSLEYGIAAAVRKALFIDYEARWLSDRLYRSFPPVAQQDRAAAS
ncbi:hypothetical protein NOR53_1117 [gamma proteobacterium NOR5-3]|nr:hypothetical protein NOR53_1117 [gamma proteobacterium NOR5-3]